MSHAANRRLTLLDDEFNDTKALLLRMKVAQLKDVVRAIGFPIKGRKKEIQDTALEFFEEGRAISDSIRLLAVRTIVLKVGNNDPIPKYESLYMALQLGAFNYTNVANQYSQTAPQPPKRPANTAPPPQRGPTLLFNELPFYSPRRMVGSQPLVLDAQKNRTVRSLKFDLTLHEQQTALGPNMKLFLFAGVAGASPFNRVHLQYPNPVEIHVNGTQIKQNLRGIKGKPETVSPVDLSELLRAKSNSVDVVYINTTEAFFLYIYIVETYSSEALLKQVLDQPHIQPDLTKAEILREYQADNDDDMIIATSSISLRCPLSYTKMKYPTKGIFCNHIQCFDGLYFLQLQQQIPTWTCPICNKKLVLDHLAISDYYMDILGATASVVELVTLNKDGSWEAEAEIEDLDDDDDLPAEKQETARPEEPQIEIISLDSDSDEEPPSPRVATQHVERPSNLPTPQSVQRVEAAENSTPAQTQQTGELAKNAQPVPPTPSVQPVQSPQSSHVTRTSDGAPNPQTVQPVGNTHAPQNVSSMVPPAQLHSDALFSSSASENGPSSSQNATQSVNVAVAPTNTFPAALVSRMQVLSTSLSPQLSALQSQSFALQPIRSNVEAQVSQPSVDLSENRRPDSIQTPSLTQPPQTSNIASQQVTKEVTAPRLSDPPLKEALNQALNQNHPRSANQELATSIGVDVDMLDEDESVDEPVRAKAPRKSSGQAQIDSPTAEGYLSPDSDGSDIPLIQVRRPPVLSARISTPSSNIFTPVTNKTDGAQTATSMFPGAPARQQPTGHHDPVIPTEANGARKLPPPRVERSLLYVDNHNRGLDSSLSKSQTTTGAHHGPSTTQNHQVSRLPFAPPKRANTVSNPSNHTDSYRPDQSPRSTDHHSRPGTHASYDYTSNIPYKNHRSALQTYNLSPGNHMQTYPHQSYGERYAPEAQSRGPPGRLGRPNLGAGHSHSTSSVPSSVNEQWSQKSHSLNQHLSHKNTEERLARHPPSHDTFTPLFSRSALNPSLLQNSPSLANVQLPRTSIRDLLLSTKGSHRHSPDPVDAFARLRTAAQQQFESPQKQASDATSRPGGIHLQPIEQPQRNPSFTGLTRNQINNGSMSAEQAFTSIPEGAQNTPRLGLPASEVAAKGPHLGSFSFPNRHPFGHRDGSIPNDRISKEPNVSSKEQWPGSRVSTPDSDDNRPPSPFLLAAHKATYAQKGPGSSTSRPNQVPLSNLSYENSGLAPTPPGNARLLSSSDIGEPVYRQRWGELLDEQQKRKQEAARLQAAHREMTRNTTNLIRAQRNPLPSAPSTEVMDHTISVDIANNPESRSTTGYRSATVSPLPPPPHPPPFSPSSVENEKVFKNGEDISLPLPPPPPPPPSGSDIDTAEIRPVSRPAQLRTVSELTVPGHPMEIDDITSSNGNSRQPGLRYSQSAFDIVQKRISSSNQGMNEERPVKESGSNEPTSANNLVGTAATSVKEVGNSVGGSITTSATTANSTSGTPRVSFATAPKDPEIPCTDPSRESVNTSVVASATPNISASTARVSANTTSIPELSSSTSVLPPGVLKTTSGVPGSTSVSQCTLGGPQTSSRTDQDFPATHSDGNSATNPGSPNTISTFARSSGTSNSTSSGPRIGSSTANRDNLNGPKPTSEFSKSCDTAGPTSSKEQAATPIAAPPITTALSNNGSITLSMTPIASSTTTGIGHFEASEAAVQSPPTIPATASSSAPATKTPDPPRVAEETESSDPGRSVGGLLGIEVFEKVLHKNPLREGRSQSFSISPLNSKVGQISLDTPNAKKRTLSDNDAAHTKKQTFERSRRTSLQRNRAVVRPAAEIEVIELSDDD